MTTERSSIRSSLWRHRDFRLLWAGQTVSELGSQVSQLALPLLAIDRLHAGAFAIGLLTMMSTMPFLLIGLPAGAWVDRVRRRPVLIGADVGRALLLGSVPAAWALHVLTMAQLYVVSLLAGILTVFFDVAYQSFLPALVDRQQLVEGNAKLGGSMAGAQVAGPAVTGQLVQWVGAATAVLTDAVSFVVSFLSLIAIRASEERPAHRVEGPRTTLRSEIGEGLRFIWHEPRIRCVSLTTSTSNLFNTMGMSVFLLFLRRQIGLSPAHIGLLFTIGSVGGLVGATLASRLAARFGLGHVILGAIVVCGLSELAYPLVTPGNADVVVSVGGFLLSAGVVIYNINQVSLRQALCPLPLQGRMNASVRFLVWGSMPIGALLGGTFGTSLGLRPTLWIAGIGGLGAFAWIKFSPIPAMRAIPESASAPTTS